MLKRALSSSLLAVLLLLGAAASSPAQADAWDHVRDGDRLADAGRFEEAVAAYTRALSSRELRGEDLGRAHYSRGLANGRLARRGPALRDFEAAVAANPRHVSAHSSICFEQMLAEKYLKALDSCDEALRLDSNHGPTYSIRAKIWVRKGFKDEAMKDFNQAIKLQPGNFIIRCERARLHDDNGSRENAIADLRAYEQHRPQWARNARIHPCGKLMSKYGL